MLFRNRCYLSSNPAKHNLKATELKKNEMKDMPETISEEFFFSHVQKKGDSS